MRLTDELAVAAPADRTWALLLDPPRLASALPAATLEPAPVGGSYRGTMGRYAGTATLQDVDEDERVVTYYLQGHENGGQGTAAATIVARIHQSDGGTRLVVETELAVAGAAAERERAESAAGALLAEAFGGAVGSPEEPLDMGAAAVALSGSTRLGRVRTDMVGERVLLVLAGIAAGFAFGRLLGRRR